MKPLGFQSSQTGIPFVSWLSTTVQMEVANYYSPGAVST